MAVFAASAGEKTVVPGTLLSLGIEVKIESKGDTLKELDEDSQAVLKKANEFEFKTEAGVYGSVMAYQPKDEFADVITEWCEAMAGGLADAVKSEGKLIRRETAKFGSRRCHFFAMESEGCTTEFALIGGKEEIVLIALSAEQKNTAELTKVMASLSYGGEAASERKPVAEQE
ncbi:MAG: hypothetical protein JNK63_07340 [Chthonomonas sp.]|nr:hypothetical protein [Chthonomonas sp.]